MTRYNDDPLRRSDDGYEMSDTQYIRWVGYTSGVDKVLDYIVRVRPRAASLIAELRDAVTRGDI